MARYAQAVGSGPEVSRSLLALLERPRTLDELRLSLHVSRREVEAAVEALRLSGEPIVGGNDGLHLTTDPDELAAYVEARRRRLATIYRGNRALRSTVRRLRERVDLTLFGEIAA